MNFTSEDQRYDYPLTADSVVVDVGGYHGGFAATIAARYGCAIWCFEPVAEFRAIISARNIPNLTLVPCALGSMNGLVRFGVNGDSTGLFKEDGRREVVVLMDAAAAIGSLPNIDLLKLNIEGSEYAVLRRLTEEGLHRKCRNIQVQFHPAIDSDEKRNAIRAELARSHEETYCEPYVWENWRLKQ